MFVRKGAADPSRAEAALGLYAALPLKRFDHLPLLERIFRLRDHFTPDDAAYVVLAEARSKHRSSPPTLGWPRLCGASPISRSWRSDHPASSI